MTETVLVGEGGAKKRRPRWQFIVGLAVAVVFAAGAGVWVRTLQDKPKNPNAKKENVPAVVGDVRSQLQSGKPDEAAKTINDALANPSTSKHDKYLLYIEQGRIAQVNGKPQEAADAFTKAWALEQTYDLAGRLGSVWQELGDKDKALLYYKKAKELNPKDSPSYEAEDRVLQQMIESLEAGQ